MQEFPLMRYRLYPEQGHMEIVGDWSHDLDTRDW
jgi:hypothetical protein